MAAMQLGRPGAETFWVDAPALQLEQKTKSRAEKVVEVVDAEPRERIRIERCRLAAPQARPSQPRAR